MLHADSARTSGCCRKTYCNLPQKGYILAEPSVPEGSLMRRSVIALVTRAAVAGNNKSW
jgi:hypothetical protein